MSGTPVTSNAGSASAVRGARGLQSRAGPVGAVIAVATLFAVALRLYQLSRPGYLLGITEYDDGADLGSAIRLVHGVLPYRDFIMVQPPGITVLMAPVALATKAMSTATTMAVGRVLTALAGAAAAPLGGLLVRRRGVLAAIVTCGLLAVYPDSLAAAKTVLLEPWLVLFALLGMLAVFDRDDVAASRARLAWGGAAFGFAGAVKVWAIIPVLAVLALTASRPRRALAFAAGVAAGFLIPVLPFALTAPGAFVRSVLVAQLARADVLRIPAGYRLQQMLGLSHVTQLPTPDVVLIAVAFALAVTAVAVAAARVSRQPTPTLDWFALGTCGLVVAAFLWPADFYYHYSAFLAPFLALALALPSARLAAALSGREAVRRDAARPSPGGLLQRAAPAVAGAAVAVLAVLQFGSEANLAAAVSAREIAAAQRLIPSGACVVTDQVAYTIAINRFNSTVPGCPVMVDGVGTDYTLSQGRNGQTGAGDTAAVRRFWLAAFSRAQYAWLTGQAYLRIPWTPGLRSYFTAHFRRISVSLDTLYARDGQPAR